MNDTGNMPSWIKMSFTAAVIILIICLGQIVFGNNGLYELKKLRGELNRIQSENIRLEEENINLYRTINRLKNDPEYIENVARQELQMIAEDEIVFKFRQSREERPSGKQANPADPTGKND